MITGAELFVKALQQERVDTLFAYPGGQAIDLFHALYGVEAIQVILPRHEQGLIHAADGYARVSGKTGVCLVTSGPGATNLVTGIATAQYDSVPLVCFTGQVATSLIGNDAFQEVDIVGITRSICKYAVTVRRREDLAVIIKKAFMIANSGKPGVVVVDLPKDIQQAVGSDDYPSEVSIRGYQPIVRAHQGQLKKAASLLQQAKRPVLLIGGGVKISHAQKELCLLAEKTGIPVVTTMMGKGALPTTHPLYVGNLGIHGCYAANKAISECDLLFSIGTRFNDRITGSLTSFAPHASIVHIDIEPASISRTIVVDVPIVADAKQAILALLDLLQPCAHPTWMQQIQAWQLQHPLTMHATGMTPEVIFHHINHHFPQAIIATDVGQNQLWAFQFLELNEQKQLLTSGGLGTMGYGLPAAIGAKLAHPEKDVLAICGDGGFQMNLQELATAMVYELGIIICIFHNGYLGNVRQWQELFFEKQYSSTCLRYRKSCKATCNQPSASCPAAIPDFIKLAQSYGAMGIRITEESEIEDALCKANKQDLPHPGVYDRAGSQCDANRSARQCHL